jgi:hypothetical protein
MKYRKELFTIALLSIICSSSLLVNAQENYPVPVKTDRMLFYLQRSFNRNTIIYDLNRLPDGSVNPKKPVNIYWIRYQDDGRKAELSYLQNKAFGIRCKVSDRGESGFIMHFNYFDKREILLSKTNTGDYKAFVNINHEMAELVSAFIKSESNSSGMPQSFKFLEFHGISVMTGKLISEKIML